jgi:hypothetical protein
MPVNNMTYRSLAGFELLSLRRLQTRDHAESCRRAVLSGNRALLTMLVRFMPTKELFFAVFMSGNGERRRSELFY